jgi:hypothetical protein
MTTDTDRLFDLDEALGKIGRLAYAAWNDGKPAFDEVIEEVVLTCGNLMDDSTDDTLRAEVEAVLPKSWCPDLSFQERLRNLIEVRKPWLDCNEALQTRLSKLEVMAGNIGDPPLAVDPDAVAQLRLMLREPAMTPEGRQPELRMLVLDRDMIELLRGVFGISYGPTLVEPAILCPRCEGEGARSYGAGPVPCQRCGGEGKVPDVDGMRLRIAELEHERTGLRRVVEDANAMMAYMRGPRDVPPRELWDRLERTLADYRNNGYENSDHPDDFTAPTWSPDDPEPETEEVVDG